MLPAAGRPAPVGGPAAGRDGAVPAHEPGTPPHAPAWQLVCRVPVSVHSAAPASRAVCILQEGCCISRSAMTMCVVTFGMAVQKFWAFRGGYVISPLNFPPQSEFKPPAYLFPRGSGHGVRTLRVLRLPCMHMAVPCRPAGMWSCCSASRPPCSRPPCQPLQPRPLPPSANAS